MQFRLCHYAVLLLTCGMVFAAAVAEEPAPDGSEKISYYTQVRPIFQAHCQGCHQPAKRGGQYVMTEFSALVKGGESETAAIVPGKPHESYLVDMITPADGDAEMPKGKDPLSQTDIDLITRWIAEGAIDDTPAGAATRYNMDNPPVYELPPVINSLDFSPEGTLLAVSGFHEVLLHKADGSGIVARLVGMSERIESAEFSPDGKLLAVTGGSPGRMGEVQIWDVAAKQLKLSVPVTYDTVYGGSWSPDGKLVGFGCADNTARAMDVATGKQVSFSGAHGDWVLDTVFSKEGTHLISVSRDRTMKLVIVETSRFVDNITSITPGALKGGLVAVDRHPTKDELLVGGSDGVPKTYNMFRTKKRVIGDDYQLIRAFPKMPGRVFSVAYGPQGDRVVAGSSFNRQGELRTYQAADGKLQWKLQTGPIYAVAFHPQGNVVAAAGFDGDVLLIDAASGKVNSKFIPVPLTDQKEKEVAATANK